MDLLANPFGQNSHRFATGRINLGFAPGTGFGKAEGVEVVGNEADAVGGANEDEANGFTGGGRIAGSPKGGGNRRRCWESILT